MADIRAERIAELIEPLRVEPGSRVHLAKDFDPALQGRHREEEGRRRAARGPGIALLAEYQARLAAQDTYGVLVVPAGARRRRQGRDDPPRDERGQPAGRARQQLQGALRRGARPRLPVALRAPAARPRRDRRSSTGRTTRRCSSCGCTRRTSTGRGCPTRRGAGRLEAPLPGDQRLGALPHRQRLPGREAVPEPVEGGAADPLPAADRPARARTGSSPRPTSRERARLGRLPAGVLGDALAHEHRVGAVVRDPGRPQVVRAHLRRRRCSPTR